MKKADELEMMLAEAEAANERVGHLNRMKGVSKTVYLVPIPINSRKTGKPIDREEFLGEVRRAKVPLKFVVPEDIDAEQSRDMWSEIGSAKRALAAMGGVQKIRVVTIKNTWVASLTEAYTS